MASLHNNNNNNNINNNNHAKPSWYGTIVVQIPNKFTSETITKKPLIYSFDNVLDGEKERKTEMIIISSIM